MKNPAPPVQPRISSPGHIRLRRWLWAGITLGCAGVFAWLMLFRESHEALYQYVPGVQRCQWSQGWPLHHREQWVDIEDPYRGFGTSVIKELGRGHANWAWRWWLDLVFCVGTTTATVLVLHMILAAVTKMIRWRRRPAHTRVSPPATPDESLDGEPASPGWDEAKNR